MIILEGAVFGKGDDSWVCHHSSYRNYSARLAYVVLLGVELVSGERSTSVVNSLKLVWNSKATIICFEAEGFSGLY
jgi:hypothetical protein